MNIRVVIHEDRCISRFAPRYEKAQKFLDNEVLKDSSPYVPMDTGALMRSAETGSNLGSGKVEWTTPYAGINYYCTGRNFSKAKHPKACAQWFEVAKAANVDAWISGVGKILKGK